MKGMYIDVLYFDKFESPDPLILGKKNKYDNNIYVLDIETTSYIKKGKTIEPAINYINYTKEEQESYEYGALMYVWQFSVNDIVYYGRTWEEFKILLNVLDHDIPQTKYVFVHNLSFEFQFLKSVFHFEEVTARKSHKVMTAKMRDYNIIFKCSYIMSNCALNYLSDLFNLPVEKKVGDLDYTKLRTSETPLTDKELGYCKYDCLVVYHYILFELKTYEDVKHIPTTSTGHVRRELQDLIRTDYKYKRIVNKAINTDPHVYNLLVESFFGGYTHSNWIYTDQILKDIYSYDETSAYPYVLVTCKFPSTEFKKCNIKDHNLLSYHFAYILVVQFKNLKCKYYNNFISKSKCRYLKNGKYDNGRIIEAEELEIVLTDIDFRFILDTYKGFYKIIECYYSKYNYLPKQFIEFCLDKYVLKTKYKNVPAKELEYQKEKNKFNALYGMSVTNTIRDNVKYEDETGEWFEEELTNDEIEDKLHSEKNKSFLSFAYGVWVTAYARDNLLRRVIELDDYVVYCDTDSIKLLPGYNKNVFDEYNKSVLEKIEHVSKLLEIDIDKYMPADVNGIKHPLGIFEEDSHYEEFITQGAKKYAFTKYVKNSKIKDNSNVIKHGEDKSLILDITVAGVPKNGANGLKSLEDFKDDFVFEFKDTNKNLLIYCENQEEIEITDYLGNILKVKDKTGCCLIPTTYVLGKSTDYVNLISDESSKRAIYKERKN